MASDFNLLSGGNKVIFTIKDDGSIELGPQMTPAEASRQFWELLSASNPLQQQLREAREENAALKEQIKEQAIHNQHMAHNLKHATEAYNTLQPLKNENAALRALLMLARGLIINDCKPAAVSLWVSKHDAFLAEHKEQPNG